MRVDIEEINGEKSLHNAYRESRIHAFHRKRIVTPFPIYSILRATVIHLRFKIVQNDGRGCSTLNRHLIRAPIPHEAKL